MKFMYRGKVSCMESYFKVEIATFQPRLPFLPSILIFLSSRLQNLHNINISKVLFYEQYWKLAVNCEVVFCATSLPEERKKLSKGLFQSYTLSPELQAVVGEQEMSRAEVTKQLWLYIRKNNLQDPDNKRRIICDDALRSLFEMHAIDMFEMNKVLSKHIGSPEQSSAAGRRKGSKVSGLGKSAGLLKPQPISEALQTFLGVSATEIVRSDAVKLIWGYIKENNLQDPANKRNIICDSNLQELFQCESFQGFHLSRLLVPHFPKRP